MPDKPKPADDDDPTKPLAGHQGDTKEKPPAEGPKKEPPIDGNGDPPPPKGDAKKDKKDPNAPPVVVNVHIHIDGGDNGIKIGRWVPVDDPRDKKAKKRVAWKRVQIHRTTGGKEWFIEEVVSDNGEILEVSVTPVSPPNPEHIGGAPFKSLTKTRDGLALVDKDGKTHKYDAEQQKYYPPTK